jgi:hypothetical protein
MAPEQANGEAERIGPRTDIFNLGAMLYQLVTGRPLYQGSNGLTVVEQARQARIISPRQLQPALPRALERICLKALAVDPAERYGSAEQMAQALHGYLRRPRRIALALGLLLLVGVVALALAIGPWRKLPQNSSPVNAVAARGEPLELRSFEIRASRAGVGSLGEVGPVVRDIRLNDAVRIMAKFSKPAYCFLIAFNPDGKEQLCYPSDADDNPAPEEVPALVEELRFPKSLSRNGQPRGFPLEDGVGMQAFVLLISSKPLPAYAQWQKEAGVAPWQVSRLDGIWRFDGKDFESSIERGKVRDLDLLPQALVKLCHFFQNRAGIDAVQVVAFPVNPLAP